MCSLSHKVGKLLSMCMEGVKMVVRLTNRWRRKYVPQKLLVCFVKKYFEKIINVFHNKFSNI